MLTASYTLKIKHLNDSLNSISVNIDDDKTVQICLELAIRTTFLARENPSSSNL